jgi:hypothetical protein
MGAAQREARKYLFAHHSSMCTIRDLLKQYGCPGYLKVDIEGADLLCVRALEHSDVRPKYVSIESSKTSWRDLLDEFRTLEKLGYTTFQVVDQCTHRSGQFRTLSGGSIPHSSPSGGGRSAMHSKDLAEQVRRSPHVPSHLLCIQHDWQQHFLATDLAPYSRPAETSRTGQLV